ncbi:MFS transporter [Kordiimonas aestuarii]|uniref:MFS transporter n=1 Tax=Kordiimonas aestuarii TaxID=1005925 RepID=UPI0021D29DBE|nr:MFS transporter [Kordiimonas aestuarii]
MPVIIFAVFIDLLGFGIIIPILPFLTLQYGGDALVGAALMSIYSLTTFLAGPLWGRLSDRIGRRPALAATFFGSTIAYIMLAFSDSLAMLFVARAMSGMMAGNVGIAMAAMSDLTDESNRGRAMGLIGAAFGLGFAFGPFIGGLLGSVGGEPNVFIPGLAAAGFSFTAMFLTARFMPETSKKKQASFNEEGPAAAPLPHWTTVLRAPGALALYAMFFIAAVGQSICFAITPFWANTTLGWSQSQVGFLLAGVGLCVAAIQSMAVGPLFRIFGEVKSLLLGAATQLAGLALLFAGPVHMATAIIAFPMVMSGLTISFPALNSLVSQRSDRRIQGTALGLSSGVSALGRVFGPISGGFIFEGFSAYTPYLAVAMTGAIIFGWAMHETRRVARLTI